jgi:hypothetical protein
MIDGGKHARMRDAEAQDSKTEPEPLRKPYRKPEFRFERVFETMALACGKISPSQPQWPA